SSSNSSSKNSEKKVKAGYLTRDVMDASLFEVKKEIKALQPDKGAMQWWDRLDDLWNDEIKWNTMDHNGVVFAAPYEPHNVKMQYDGMDVDLTPNQEEVATMFGVMSASDWGKKPRFRNNFLKEFRKILCDRREARTHEYITDLSKCNFDKILEWYEQRKEQEKEMKKDSEYKNKMKEMKQEMDSKYGWAVVDGVLEKVGNYKVEPPGLFRGRGEHPKMGLIKKRLQPEDVILNIGKGMAIPPCPIFGHKWGGVVHDQSVTYIAKWVENINGQHKFVYLHSSSRFKGVADVKKYEKARQLKKHVTRIRQDYESKLSSPQREVKQLATAIWIIDHLSIRVGNEKDTDEEADTVGVCSLRCEHIQFDPEKECQITFDFLGKDSMRYCQTIQIPSIIYHNLKEFTKNKKADVDIFEKIDSSIVNNYLKEQMDGLTAKVFRTHNASVCLEKELFKNEHATVGAITRDSPLADKLFFYTQCNKQVAILCNHQRTVPKSHEQQLEKIDAQIKELKEHIDELKRELDIAQGKKKPSKDEKDKRIRQPDQLFKAIDAKKKQLRKKELDKEMKSENKEIALGTSKINYMDPRITVAWCKRMEVPIEKVFNKSLLDKFPWSMSVPLNFEF
ncbi:DNA topoisomerase type I, partial [Reticulomyxa filosa]